MQNKNSTLHRSTIALVSMYVNPLLLFPNYLLEVMIDIPLTFAHVFDFDGIGLHVLDVVTASIGSLDLICVFTVFASITIAVELVLISFVMVASFFFNSGQSLVLWS